MLLNVDNFAIQNFYDHVQIAKIDRFVQTNFNRFLKKFILFKSYHIMT